MAEEPDNLVLVMLRRMDERIDDRFNRIDERLDRIEFDVHDLKVRTTGVEEGLAGVNRRLDRLEDSASRIERRLNLVEPTR
jgi:archaellum component FlaC